MPGPGDDAPLRLGNGYAGGLVTPDGYRFVIERRNNIVNARYLSGGDPKFGEYVERNWRPGLNDRQLRQLSDQWLRQQRKQR